MALAVDATANGTNSAATITFNHTCTGSNLVLVCCVSNDSTSGSVSTVTYGGQNFVKAIAENVGTNNKRTEIWYLINPSTGTNSLVVTLSGSPSSGAKAGSVSFTGADQTSNVITSYTSANKSATANPSLTLNTTMPSAALVNALTNDTGKTVVVDGNDTSIYNSDLTFSTCAAAYRLTTGVAGDYATGYTATSGNYSMCAVGIKPKLPSTTRNQLRPHAFSPGLAR